MSAPPLSSPRPPDLRVDASQRSQPQLTPLVGRSDGQLQLSLFSFLQSSLDGQANGASLSLAFGLDFDYVFTAIAAFACPYPFLPKLLDKTVGHAAFQASVVRCIACLPFLMLATALGLSRQLSLLPSEVIFPGVSYLLLATIWSMKYAFVEVRASRGMGGSATPNAEPLHAVRTATRLHRAGSASSHSHSPSVAAESALPIPVTRNVASKQLFHDFDSPAELDWGACFALRLVELAFTCGLVSGCFVSLTDIVCPPLSAHDFIRTENIVPVRSLHLF